MQDDLGHAELGYHRPAGYKEVQTPVIDGLVKDGVNLDRFCEASAPFARHVLAGTCRVLPSLSKPWLVTAGGCRRPQVLLPHEVRHPDGPCTGARERHQRRPKRPQPGRPSGWVCWHPEKHDRGRFEDI